MLEKLYASPQDFVYPFQTFVLPEYVKAFKHEWEQLGEKDVLFVERSFFTSLYVFAVTCLDDVRFSILRRIVDQFIDLYPTLGRVDAIFYLDTPVDVCVSRLVLRNRAEEKKVHPEYLRSIEKSYLKWKDQDYFPYPANKVTACLDGKKTLEELTQAVFATIDAALF